MYKVILDFKDLRDDGHEYKVGDTYPHSGKADADRVKHLMTPTSMRGALIEEVKEMKKVEKAEEPAPTTTRRKKKED